MKTVSLTQAQRNLSDLIDEARDRRRPIMIRKRSKDAVVLVDAGLFKLMRRVQDTFRSKKIRESLKQRGRTLDAVLKELDLDT